MPSISHAIGRSLLALGTLIPLSLAASAFAGGAVPARNDEARFLAENDTAMTKMMDGMAVKPRGNVDEDFVAMMVPHHQGAIDMAEAELSFGHNQQLRRIAQEIVVEQQQEIVAMRLALGQTLPPSAPAPDQQRPSDLIPTPANAAPNPSTLNLNKESK
jgi:Domain of unknown function (DUF305)